MPNAGSPVSRYTSFPPPSTTRFRHNTGRGKFLINLARTLPLLPMLSLQISRSPGGTGVCLQQLPALFVPRVPGRRARAGWEGSGSWRRRGVGLEGCAWPGWRGARGWERGAGGGGLLGGARRLAHTRCVTLWGRKMGVVERQLRKEEGEAWRLETPPGVDGKRSDSRAGGAPGRSPGRFPVALHAPGILS